MLKSINFCLNSSLVIRLYLEGVLVVITLIVVTDKPQSLSDLNLSLIYTKSSG